MRNSSWIYESLPSLSREEKEEHKHIDATIYSILKQRKLSCGEEFSSDPFLLQDVDKAVALLEKYKKTEKIWIYGDYDVDGITSVSLCYLALQDLGYEVEYYIPLRDEGYGLNQEAIKSIHDRGGKIIISVDCGVSSIAEVDYANSLGIDMIITDHHEIQGATLPKAKAVINPKREDNLYDFPYLAGVGTAFFLIAALFLREKKEKELNKYLDIVAIGTVADIVPLVHDNRILVQQGLKLLAKSQWTGIRILVKRLFSDYETRRFSSYDIGFIIAPIFNAAGRLEDAKNSVKLFLETDVQEANRQIDALLANNQARKKLQEEIYQATLAEIAEKNLDQKNLILVAKDTFHHGVIGIVASKIVERFYKPTIILEIKKEEGIATASCRSISGVNIVEAIASASDLLLRYGGHAGAAGFSIAIDKIPLFYERVNSYLNNILTEEILSKKIKITKDLEPLEIQYPLCRDMELLEPFGSQNPSPIFSMRNCRLDRVRLIGTDKKHLMCNVIKGDMTFWNCVWFQAADVYEELLSSREEVDVAFHVKLEKYKGRYQYKLMLDDIQFSTSNQKNQMEKSFHREELRFQEIHFPLEYIFYLKYPHLAEHVKLQLEDKEARLFSKKSYLGNFDVATTKLLYFWKNQENADFRIEKKDFISEEEHYVLHLLVHKEKHFSSLALKEGAFFQDLKHFLFGKEGNYNSIQAKALASFIKEKQNTFVRMEKGRGIRTLLRSLSLYGDFFHKRYKVLENWNGEPSLQSLVSDYDFLIFQNPKKVVASSIPSFVISEQDLTIPGSYQRIQDDYSLPTHITWIEESDIAKHELVFSHLLSKKKQALALTALEEGKHIYATKDLLVHL